MQTLSRSCSALAATAALIALGGCGQDQHRSPPPPPPITETALDLAVQDGLSSEIKQADSTPQDAIADDPSKKKWRDVSISGTFRVGHEKRPPRAVIAIKDSDGVFHDSAPAELEKIGEQQYRFSGVVTARDQGRFTVEVLSAGKIVATEEVQVE